MRSDSADAWSLGTCAGRHRSARVAFQSSALDPRPTSRRDLIARDPKAACLVEVRDAGVLRDEHVAEELLRDTRHADAEAGVDIPVRVEPRHKHVVGDGGAEARDEGAGRDE